MPRPLLIVLMIYVTIVRHEGLHALSAWLEGAPVKAVRLFPGYRDDLGFFFGYVAYGDGASWITTFAPFPGALLSVVVSYVILRKCRLKSFWKELILWLGLISPLADLAYNYANGLWRPVSDGAELMVQLNPLSIHVFFISAILASVWVLRSESSGNMVTSETSIT